MPNKILTEYTASISELKKHPMETVQAANGNAIAILNRNNLAFYCIPTETYEQILDKLDDLELKQIFKARKNEESIKVSLDEL